MLSEDKFNEKQTQRDERRIDALLKQSQKLAHGSGDSKFRQMARDRAVKLRRAKLGKEPIHIASSYEPRGPMLEKLDMISRVGRGLRRGLDLYGKALGAREGGFATGTPKQALKRIGRIGQEVAGRLTLLPRTNVNPLGDAPSVRMRRAKERMPGAVRFTTKAKAAHDSEDVQEIAFPGRGGGDKSPSSLPTAAELKASLAPHFSSRGPLSRPFQTGAYKGKIGKGLKTLRRAAQHAGAVLGNIRAPKSERGDTPKQYAQNLQGLRQRKQEASAKVYDALAADHERVANIAAGIAAETGDIGLVSKGLKHMHHAVDAGDVAMKHALASTKINTDILPKFGRKK